MESEQNSSVFVRKRQYIFIELSSFLLVCAIGMTGTVFADLILFQTCRNLLGTHHQDDCYILHNDSESEAAMNLEKLIQPHASYILLIKTLLEGISPAFFALFLGPWSDKHGRKPVLIASYTGFFLVYAGLSLLTNWDFNPWIYLLTSIPLVFLGGFSAMMLSSFCYVTDITDHHNRAMRLAIFENSLACGGIVGIFIGPMIFENYGYPMVFGIATLAVSLAIIYIIFLIPETVQTDGVKYWTNPFDRQLLRELVEKATIKRDGLKRMVLWCCIGLLSVYIVVFQFTLNCGFLFATARLGWDAVVYSRYNVITITLSVVGIIVGLKFFKMIGFHDTSIAMVAAVSSFTYLMTIAFTYKSWHLYLSSILGIFSGLVSPPIRSILSKSVPPEDIGKAFSLTTAIEAILPMATNTLFMFIYSEYMPPYYPSPAHLLAAGMFVIIMIFLVVIDRRLRRDEMSYDIMTHSLVTEVI